MQILQTPNILTAKNRQNWNKALILRNKDNSKERKQHSRSKPEIQQPRILQKWHTGKPET